MIIYIAFGLKFIFEKLTRQITTYLSKILQVRLKTTLKFFWINLGTLQTKYE